MSEIITKEPEVKSSRPIFLTILCLLSFIGGSIWAVVSLIALVMPEKIIRLVYQIVKEQQGPKTEELLDPMQAEMVKSMEEVLLVNFIEYYKIYLILGSAVSLVLALASIFGVAKMWHRRKAGFWIYTVANVLAIVGMIYLEGWIAVSFTFIFIILYAIHLKKLE